MNTMQATTDSAFAAHLIQRNYALTSVDRSQPRHAYYFDASPHDMDREKAWFTKANIVETIRIANSLSALCRGDEIKPGTLAKWPCLAVAVEG